MIKVLLINNIRRISRVSSYMTIALNNKHLSAKEKDRSDNMIKESYKEM